MSAFLICKRKNFVYTDQSYEKHVFYWKCKYQYPDWNPHSSKNLCISYFKIYIYTCHNYRSMYMYLLPPACSRVEDVSRDVYYNLFLSQILKNYDFLHNNLWSGTWLYFPYITLTLLGGQTWLQDLMDLKLIAMYWKYSLVLAFGVSNMYWNLKRKI